MTTEIKNGKMRYGSYFRTHMGTQPTLQYLKSDLMKYLTKPGDYEDGIPCRLRDGGKEATSLHLAYANADAVYWVTPNGSLYKEAYDYIDNITLVSVMDFGGDSNPLPDNWTSWFCRVRTMLNVYEKARQYKKRTKKWDAKRAKDKKRVADRRATEARRGFAHIAKREGV